MAKPWIASCVVTVGMIFGLAACTNPYDPAQRAVGGHGAALGAAIGGVTGAVAGIVTTPPPPPYYGYYHHRRYARYAGRRHYCAHCQQAARNTAPGAWTNPRSDQ